MKLIALTTLIMCCAVLSFAQKPYAIKGAVTDTMATYKLVNTSVTIINQKDSTLVKFGRADAEGHFAINNMKAGKFILLLTYPGYADYAEEFSLDSLNPVKDFGNIDLILKTNLLNDVIIKGKVAAIKINGDTTEFNAGSYVIKPNSKVEDLLKQLPGIQVDKNGKITAQGQTVNKVLVDGEEFFGDDPTLVTKNIRGDMVDKVQLYDKKSDQATFTGIDDGEKSKTINIKLKEDKKNGYFGKLNAAGGTKKFYEGQAMINMFRNKEKFAAYGTLGNTGALGLSWQDAGKYSGSDGGMVFGDGMVIMSFGDSESFQGNYDGRGIPLARSGGLHYENKWNNNKYGLNTNYKLGSVNVRGTSDDLSVNNLPAGRLTNGSDKNFDNFMFRQKLDAALNIQLDSSSSLKVSIDGTLKNSNSTEDFNSYSQREDNTFINKGIRKLTNEGDDRIFNVSAFWNKKLKKKGRTISANIKQSVTENNSEGFLNSTNEFFNENEVRDSIQNIDQYKTNKSLNQTFNSNITYTEPLSKTLSLILNYGLNINNGRSNKQSFNKNAVGDYTIVDKEFSNNFELNQLSNTGGAIFNYSKGKSVINFGTRLVNVNFNQYDVLTDNTYKRTFTNWNPQVSYNYNLSKQSAFRLGYNGNMSQPSINQIQPIRVNTDPLYITLGNPDLKPAFNNNFNISYNSYKMLTSQSIWINGGISFTNNALSNSTFTDEAGKTTTQAINLLDKTPLNFNLNLSSSRKIKKINIGMEGALNGGISYNLSNNIMNKANRMSYSLGPSISHYTEKQSIHISLRPTYSTNTSTLQKNTNNNGWGATGRFDSSIELPGKVSLSLSADYQYTGKTQTFDNALSRVIVNTELSKSFFKQESLRLTLSGKDLLNQNTGFSRFANNNMISQNSYSTIQRFFLATLSWDFNKMGGSAPKK